MIGGLYFGQMFLGGAFPAPPSVGDPGTDGGGIGSTYFGQYWPGVFSSTPPSAPDPSGGAYGKLLRRAVLSRPRHRGTGEPASAPHVLTGAGSFISEAQILFLLGD